MAAQAYKPNLHTVPALLRSAHPHDRKTREERRGLVTHEQVTF